MAVDQVPCYTTRSWSHAGSWRRRRAAAKNTPSCASRDCSATVQAAPSIPSRFTQPLFAIVVPFRESPQQDRRAQLNAFEQHMTKFLGGRRFVIVVVQQTDDGRAFNRGALLNVGFIEAQLHAGGDTPLASVVFHDVDLLPSPGLLRFYAEPPLAGRPTHIAAPSTWRKYAMPGYEAVFFGGVTALCPADFKKANGFPNEYWGWGMEDDQVLAHPAHPPAIARLPPGPHPLDLSCRARCRS